MSNLQPWLALEESVAELFRAFRYEVTHDTKLRGGQTDVVARSVSPHRPNLLLEVKYHGASRAKVGIRDIEAFVSRVSRLRMDGIIDQGYLITNTGFTADARGALASTPQEHFVFLETFDGLMRRLVDLEAYHRDFIRHMDRTGRITSFVPLSVVDTTHAASTAFDLGVGEVLEVPSQTNVLHIVADRASFVFLEEHGSLSGDDMGRCTVRRSLVNEVLASELETSKQGPTYLDSLHATKLLLAAMTDDELVDVRAARLQALARSMHKWGELQTVDPEASEIVRAMLEALTDDELVDLNVTRQYLQALADVSPSSLLAWVGRQSFVIRRRLERFRHKLTVVFSTKYPRRDHTATEKLGPLAPYLLFEASQAPWDEAVLHERMDALAWLRRAVADPSLSLLILLGDFGAGKTTIVNRFMYELLAHQDAPERLTRMPILINLKNYNKVPDFRTLLSNSLAEFSGSGIGSISLFQRLHRRGFFVLILDGFDEMLAKVTKPDRRRCFLELAEFLGEKSKVVITGRPGYFPDHRELEDVLAAVAAAGAQEGVRINHAVACMQLLDEGGVETLLSLHSLKDRLVIRRLLRDQPGIMDLARRPVLGVMVAQTAAELLKIDQVPITARRLYEIYTDRWVQIEEDKGAFRVLIDPAKKSTFIRYLAMQMHLSQELRLHFTNLASEVRDYFCLQDAEMVDHFSHDIRTCSFLRRDDGGHYEFMHKSFMEFLVALEFERFGESPFADRFDRPLSAEMIAFLDPEKLPEDLRELIVGELANRLKDAHERFASAQDRAVGDQDWESAANLRDEARNLARAMKDLGQVTLSSMRLDAVFAPVSEGRQALARANSLRFDPYILPLAEQASETEGT